MFKQLMILILFTVLAVIFMHQIAVGFGFIAKTHQYLSHGLSYVFSGGPIGLISRRALALLIIPIAIGLMIQLCYWFSKRRLMPYLMTIIWLVWLILLSTAAIVD